jgi:GNAT superfamily N-acetyltransferase
MKFSISQVQAESEKAEEFDLQIAQRLRAHNESHGRAYDFKPLKLSAHSSEGALVGGLVGVTGWDWLMVDRLVVDEATRGSGVGSLLMQAAMSEARERGCIGALLDTFSFQARGFYQKLGFEVFATLSDMPPGFERYWMRCKL